MAVVDRKLFGNRYYIGIESPDELKELIEKLPVTMGERWKCSGELEFVYDERIRVYIPHDQNNWRKGYLEFGYSNIYALDNSFLTNNKKTEIMNRFVTEVIETFCELHTSFKHGWQWDDV